MQADDLCTRSSGICEMDIENRMTSPKTPPDLLGGKGLQAGHSKVAQQMHDIAVVAQEVGSSPLVSARSLGPAILRPSAQRVYCRKRLSLIMLSKKEEAYSSRKS